MNGSERHAPTQVGVRERFNEKLDYVAASVKSRKDEALSAYSRGPNSIFRGGLAGEDGSTLSQVNGGRAQSSYGKKRILDRGANMGEDGESVLAMNLNIDD